MSLENEFVALVDLIYRAAFDAELWEPVVLRLGEALQTRVVNIGVLDPANELFASVAPHIDPQALRQYGDVWANRNPLWQRSHNLPTGQLFWPSSVMEPEDFLSTAFFNDWWQQQGLGLRTLGTNILRDGSVTGVLAAAKDSRQSDFAPDDVRFFEALIPHFIRAIEVHRRVHTFDLRLQVASTALDRIPQGIFIVDASGRILFANASAQAALAAGDGVRLVEGVLSLSDGSSRLARLIASCDRRAAVAQGPGGSLQVLRGPRRPALQMQVSPFDAGMAAEATWLGPRRAVAMVMLKDPELDRLRLEQRLRRRFELTAAEAALAVEIAQGDGREAAAARRGVSITTVRAQLSSIFAKMGIRRQAELVRVVLGEDWAIARCGSEQSRLRLECLVPPSESQREVSAGEPVGAGTPRQGRGREPALRDKRSPKRPRAIASG